MSFRDLVKIQSRWPIYRDVCPADGKDEGKDNRTLHIQSRWRGFKTVFQMLKSHWCHSIEDCHQQLGKLKVETHYSIIWAIDWPVRTGGALSRQVKSGDLSKTGGSVARDTSDRSCWHCAWWDSDCSPWQIAIESLMHMHQSMANKKQPVPILENSDQLW